MAEMRAAVIHKAFDIRVEKAARPEPKNGELLLRVRTVGICGSDLHWYREGAIGASILTEPRILGHEFSAEVVDDRGSRHGLPPGTLVAVDPARPCGRCEWCLRGDQNLCAEQRFAGGPALPGGLAEYHTAPPEALFPVPPGFDAATAAMLEPLGVAIHTLDLARLRPMDNVAVVGAGAIGLLLIQVARTSGAGRIWAIDPLAYRTEAATRVGADDADVDYHAIDRWTGGRGADVVLEATNSPTGPEHAVACARVGGRIVLVGIPDGNRFSLTASEARRRALTIKWQNRMGHVYPRAIEMVQAGRVNLEPIMSHRFPLDRVPDAFRFQNAYQEGVLKTMIEVG
jgi:L-iditol 2-dehydrogenase